MMAFLLAVALVAASCASTGMVTKRPVVRVVKKSGVIWQESLESNTYTYDSLVCPTADDCIAGGVLTKSVTSWDTNSTIGIGPGVIAVTTDGGSHWINHLFPQRIMTVACLSVSRCLAIEDGPTRQGKSWSTWISVDGGMTWTRQDSAAPTGIESISCPSSLDCVSVGYTSGKELGQGAIGGGEPVTWTTHDGGLTWQKFNQPTNVTNTYVTHVSCPSIQWCMAVGGQEIAISSTAGVTWQILHLPTLDGLVFTSGLGGITSLSCPSVGVCVLVGSAQKGESDTAVPVWIKTTNSGKTWSVHVIHSVMQISGAAVTCPQVNTCVALYNLAWSLYTSVRLGTMIYYLHGSAATPAVMAPSFSQGPTGPVGLGTDYGSDVIEFIGVSCPAYPLCYAELNGIVVDHRVAQVTGSMYIVKATP